MAETTPAGDVGRVAFIPLEANPQLMSDLLHRLGLSAELGVHDVYSLHDADMLGFVPRPALALLLVFPVSAAYESYRLAEDAATPEYSGKGEGEPVVWFRQTIRNACGLMGLLHATANGPAREFIRECWPACFCLTAPAHPRFPILTGAPITHDRARLRPRQAPQGGHPPPSRPARPPPRDVPLPRAGAPLGRQPGRHGRAAGDRRRRPALRLLRQDRRRHAVGARRPAQGTAREGEAGEQRGCVE